MDVKTLVGRGEWLGIVDARHMRALRSVFSWAQRSYYEGMGVDAGVPTDREWAAVEALVERLEASAPTPR